MSTGTVIKEIAAERNRQRFAEGWDEKHDDKNNGRGQLAFAAASYALADGSPPDKWPWDGHWWKPTTKRRNLVKAAALIVAEIERLDRHV